MSEGGKIQFLTIITWFRNCEIHDRNKVPAGGWFVYSV